MMFFRGKRRFPPFISSEEGSNGQNSGCEKRGNSRPKRVSRNFVRSSKFLLLNRIFFACTYVCPEASPRPIFLLLLHSDSSLRAGRRTRKCKSSFSFGPPDDAKMRSRNRRKRRVGETRFFFYLSAILSVLSSRTKNA